MKRLGSCQNRIDWSSNISGISYFFDLTILHYFYISYSAAKHMSGTCKFYFYIIIDPEFHLIWHPNKEFQAGSGISLSVNWIHLRQSFFDPAFIESYCIMLLYKC